MAKDTEEGSDLTTDDVLAVLEESDSPKMSTREIANSLDADRSRVRSLLDQLANEDRVKKTKRDKPKTPMWRLLE